MHKDSVQLLVAQLRTLKIKGKEVPNTLEIALVPQRKGVAQFPGLFLFTGPARMMRPVLNLAVNKIEFIGTFEQVYMEVAVTAQEMYDGKFF